MQSYDPKLKEAMAEVTAICKKYDVAGHFIMASPTNAEFRFEICPSWSCAFWEDKDEGKLRFRVKQAEVGKEKAKAILEATCHMVFAFKDLCGRAFLNLDAMGKMLETQVDIEHGPAVVTPHRDN